MELWQDHYSTLQVHPDAEIEVIQSAYRRLCKKYHPDVNPSPQAPERIKAINLAYETLSDAPSRRAFHGEWMRRLGRRPAGHVQNAGAHTEVRERVVYVNREPAVKQPPKDEGTPEASAVIKNYFNNISERDFRSAFGLISDIDKQRFSYGSYVEWQESVAAIYRIGTFKAELFKRHDDLRIDPERRYRAEEFKVSVAEKDMRTGKLSEYSFTKFAVCENGVWHVYLGYRDLTPLLVQFKTMASTKEEAVLLTQWEQYREHHELRLGLPNRKAFETYVSREAYRYRRYDRPFSVAVFYISLPDRISDEGHRDHIIKYVGYIIKKNIREIDHAAWLGDDRYGLLMAETDKRTALQAARRILRTVRHDVAACFDFEMDMRIGVTPYNGASTDELIASCMRTVDASGAAAVKKAQ
ncbi:MAG: DnaJ domain-containing protein [Oscillospiraceae bacterium]|nr:DnaJ domain-containing protein [Oscillospiraceae bacterium]